MSHVYSYNTEYRCHGSTLYCHDSIIHGNGNVIHGHNNRVYGNGNIGKGNDLIFTGNGNMMDGENNIEITQEGQKGAKNPPFITGLMNISNVSNVSNSFNQNFFNSCATQKKPSVIQVTNGAKPVTVVNTAKDGSVTFTQTTYPGSSGTTSFSSDKFHTQVIHNGGGGGGGTNKEEPEPEPELPEEELDEFDEKVDEEKANLCIICMERSIKTVILDCKHCVYCVACTRLVVKSGTECPICRKVIKKGVMRIYNNNL